MNVALALFDFAFKLSALQNLQILAFNESTFMWCCLFSKKILLLQKIKLKLVMLASFRVLKNETALTFCTDWCSFFFLSFLTEANTIKKKKRKKHVCGVVYLITYAVKIALVKKTINHSKNLN